VIVKEVKVLTGQPEIKNMDTHSTWVKRTFNPILRKLFKIEITSIVRNEEVIGYGIRKHLKNEIK
jgi:hypothetical protein